MVSRFFQHRSRAPEVAPSLDDPLELVAEVAAALSEPLTAQELAVAFLRRLRRVVPAHSTAAVMLAQPGFDTVQAIAADGPLAEDLSELAFPLSALPTELRETFDEHKPIVLLDTLIASDVIGVDGWAALCSQVPTLRSARFFCLLPLVWRESLVGVVFVRDDSKRAADARRIKLLAILAELLAASLYGAVNTGEEASRAQRVALAERLVERIGSATDLEKALAAIMEEVGRVLGATVGLVWTGTSPRDLQASAEWASAGAKVAEEIRLAPSPVERLALESDQLVVLDRTLDDQRVAQDDGMAPLRAADVAASISAPFKLPGGRVGALTYHQIRTSSGWTDVDQELVGTIAEMVSERAATSRPPGEPLPPFGHPPRDPGELSLLRSLNQVATAISSLDEPELMIREVVRASISLLGGDRGAVFRHEADGEIRVVQRWPVAAVAIADALPEEAFADRILTRQQPFVISPTSRVNEGETVGGFGEPTAVAAVPVIRAGRVSGALVVLSYNDATRFGDDDVRVLTLLAQLVAPLLFDLTPEASALPPRAAWPETSNAPRPDALASLPAFAAAPEPPDEHAATAGSTVATSADADKARAEIERLRRSQAEFLTLVSHQFRTPLTGIQGFSEMMVHEDLTADELKEFAADINRDVHRLTHILNEMVELASLAAGEVSLDLEDVDLNAIVEEAADRLRVGAAAPIRLDLEKAMPPVAADRARLGEAITRFLENAISLAPAGGEVTLTSRTNCEYAHVRVTSEGLALSPGELNRLFDPFLDDGGPTYLGGTRLGLPIARRLVELHGGEAWAESLPEHGPVMHFTLPLTGSQSLGPTRQRDTPE